MGNPSIVRNLRLNCCVDTVPVAHQVSLAAGRVRIRPWTVQVASRGLTDRDADCPSGYLGLVVAESRGKVRSSWAREVMSSLAKTLPR
jgi:hypothetical protein